MWHDPRDERLPVRSDLHAGAGTGEGLRGYQRKKPFIGISTEISYSFGRNLFVELFLLICKKTLYHNLPVHHWKNYSPSNHQSSLSLLTNHSRTNNQKQNIDRLLYTYIQDIAISGVIKTNLLVRPWSNSYKLPNKLTPFTQTKKCLSIKKGGKSRKEIKPRKNQSLEKLKV